MIMIIIITVNKRGKCFDGADPRQQGAAYILKTWKDEAGVIFL